MSAKILHLPRGTVSQPECALCENSAPVHIFRGLPVCQSCIDLFRRRTGAELAVVRELHGTESSVHS
jgi:hypothetical protein